MTSLMWRRIKRISAKQTKHSNLDQMLNIVRLRLAPIVVVLSGLLRFDAYFCAWTEALEKIVQELDGDEVLLREKCVLERKLFAMIAQPDTCCSR